MALQCKKCGKEISSQANFCSGCGAPMDQPNVQQDQKIYADMALKQCKKCGKEVSTQAKFCPGCGAPMDQPNVQQDQKIFKGWEPCPRCKSNKAESRGGCFFLLGVCLAGSGIWFLITLPPIGIFSILVGIFFMFIAPFVIKVMQCKDCHYIWRYPANKNSPKQIKTETGCLIIIGFIGFIVFLIVLFAIIGKISNKTLSSDKISPVNEQPREQLKPQAPQASQTSQEDYQIVNDTSFLNEKRSVDVRLSKRVSKEVLEKLAYKIKDSDSKKYTRTFICYYLPGMQINEGAWATTHFDPDLEVNILGLSVENKEKMEEKRQAHPGEEVVGRWLDTALQGLESEVTVFKKGNTYYIRNFYRDGSETTNEYDNRNVDNTLYLKKKGSKLGDYYAIDANGDFWRGDDSGLWSKAKKIK